MKLQHLAYVSLFIAATSTVVAKDTSPLTGTWTLVAADTLYPDGHKTHGFGDAPQGRMMIDADGRYVVEIYRTEAINFASGNKATGTAAEFKDAMLRNSVHYGHVKLIPSRQEIVFDIERSVFPNWEGKTQVRNYTLVGDRLAYKVPASSTGDGTIAISEWRRLPSSQSVK